MASLFKKKQNYHFPEFGGETRPAIAGPFEMHSRLRKTVFYTTIIRTGTVALTVLNLAMIMWTIQIMDSSIYVADGSRFGCRVQVLDEDFG